MKPRFRLPVATLLGLALAAVVPLACFSLKEPPCAFSCVTPPHRCPEQYSCQADGLCHRQGATASCGLTSPLDAAVGDAQDGGDGNAADAD